MKYTKNYKLPQWVESDRILMEDFNQMCADLEAGLESRAAAETVTALADSVNGSLKEIASNLGSAGKNCRIVWGIYTGTGTYGSGNKTTITPGFYPVLVAVGCVIDATYTSWPWFMVRPCAMAQAPMGYAINVGWTDIGVSWYGDQNAQQQMNLSGIVYYYVVLGYDKDAEING